MAQWLLNRLFDARNQRNPNFAFQGTVNWMRALALITEEGAFDDATLDNNYSQVSRRAVNTEADTLVFENMMMAYHNQASLVNLFNDSSHPYDICRSAIISWYYSTYFTCSAMVAAASGSLQETHAQTAKVWQSDIISSGLVMAPFSLNLTSLVEQTVIEEMAAYRQDNEHNLNTYPENNEQAWGAVFSYLKGTWDYEKSKIEERVRKSREFRELGVENFRTRNAQNLRNEHLSRHHVNYLVQAFRYRGKANYRDSIFLSYGYDNTDKVAQFIDDLEAVSKVFQRMAAFYLSKRVERGSWSEFVSDLEENSRLSLEPRYLQV